MTPQWELFALRYAHRPARRADNFIGGDPHDAPMPLDYYVWLARSPEGRAVLIDTGFTAEVAAQRKRQWFRCPIDSLSLLGVDAADIQDCVLTHLHYDHVGTFHKLPNAHFHLQEAELHFAVGRYMQFRQLRHSYEVEDVVGIVRELRRPGALPCGRGGALPRHHAARGAGPFRRASVRARAHGARLGGRRVGRDAFLREHGDRAALHDRLPHRPDAGRLGRVPQPPRPSTSCPATTRWSCSATARPAPRWRASPSAWTNPQPNENEPMTEETLFESGLKVRKEVLGEDYVNKSIAGADEFTRTMAEWSTEYCWGALWTRPGLDRRSRASRTCP